VADASQVDKIPSRLRLHAENHKGQQHSECNAHPFHTQ
jgi:hypothetical protein